MGQEEMKNRGQMGGRGPDGGVISKHPLGTVWHETTLMSHQSGILHSLIFYMFKKYFKVQMNYKTF